MKNNKDILLPNSEIDDIIIRRAENFANRRLTRDECSSLLSRLGSAQRGAYPDRIIVPILKEICGMEDTPEEVRHIIYGFYDNSGDLDKDRYRMKEFGFKHGSDFIVRDRVTEKFPYIVMWRVSMDNLDHVRKFDKNMVSSLSGTIRPIVGVSDKLSSAELYDLIKMAVVDTTPLVTGLRIVRQAYKRSKEALQKYIANIHLMGADMGNDLTALRRQGWGSEISLTRMSPDVPNSYMAYEGLYTFYPSSDVEQPTDTSRQRGDYLSDLENGRKLKKQKNKRRVDNEEEKAD